MVALQERLEAFRDAGVTVFGVSADSPFSQGAFREEHDIAFDLVSDMDREAIEAYDLEIDIPDLGLYGRRESGGVRPRCGGRSSATGSPTIRRTNRTTTNSSRPSNRPDQRTDAHSHR